MTIYTTNGPNKEEKEKAKYETQYAELVFDQKESGTKPTPEAAEVISRNVKRRSRNLRCILTVLVALSALIVATICLSGVLLYRHYHRSRRPQFCKVRFADEGWGKMMPVQTEQPHQLGPYTGGHHGAMSQRQFQESIEVEVWENWEEIRVQPDISEASRVWIWHDFDLGLTAYRNWDTDECFVRTLDTANIYPPQRLQDLLKMMDNPLLFPDLDVVHETMVIASRVKDPAQLGRHIHKLCSGVPVYKLAKPDEVVDMVPLAPAESLSNNVGGGGSTVDPESFVPTSSIGPDGVEIWDEPKPIARRRRAAPANPAARFVYADGAVHVVDIIRK